MLWSVKKTRPSNEPDMNDVHNSTRGGYPEEGLREDSCIMSDIRFTFFLFYHTGRQAFKNNNFFVVYTITHVSGRAIG